MILIFVGLELMFFKEQTVLEKNVIEFVHVYMKNY